jgi:hypothetical protein
MKKFISSILLCFALLEVHGQVNLVPNGSFEEYSECPEPSSAIYMANHWINPTGYSPDYFNSCAQSNQGYSVPTNIYGGQEAKTGNAYAGIITAIEGSNLREYIQVELANDLVQSKKYCVSFYVSIADNSKFASNDLGALFLETSFNQPNLIENIEIIPQIANNSTSNSLANKTEWIEITGYFIANGGEKYLVIGNFKNELSTDTTHFNDNSSYRSYHYIDDVSVILCDESSVNENESNLVSIYPNPVSSSLNIDLKNADIEEVFIVDIHGHILENIKKSEFFEKNKLEIIMDEYPLGIYFLQLKMDKTIINEKIIKI